MGETIARVGRNFFEVGIPKRHASIFSLSQNKWIQIHSLGLIIIPQQPHAILLTKQHPPNLGRDRPGRIPGRGGRRRGRSGSAGGGSGDRRGPRRYAYDGELPPTPTPTPTAHNYARNHPRLTNPFPPPTPPQEEDARERKEKEKEKEEGGGGWFG